MLRKIDTERDILFENKNVRSLNKAQIYRKDSTNSNDYHSIVVVTTQRLKDFSGSDFFSIHSRSYDFWLLTAITMFKAR